MGSKIFFLFGVSTAIFVLLLISSEVEARDLAESSSTTDLKKKVPNGINDAKYGGYGSLYAPGYGAPPGGYGAPPGGYGAPPGGYGNPPGGYGNPPGGGYPTVPPGGGCPYGCCGAGYYGRGCRCCSYAGQAAVQPKPHN
ncbi:Glycine rich protein [Melia azedarach]|uniref:Glycine rich protein n=1 Tax=Melia azedarach TaxID=155640 RepID=A0ACC1XS98_MELAZ|nr:Glycine rich protein [Melia azedarach]